MIKINEYVDIICDDFEEYLSENPSLCTLKSVNFNAGQLPDYEDIHAQQLYLLRYAYAYAFEYKSMYKNLFRNYDYSDGIRVTSIGCGSMIDYWSLARAVKAMGWKNCKIVYRGLDQIDWSRYQFENRTKDDVRFAVCNAVTVLENTSTLNADVYFFPKSISEFSQDDMERICNCFMGKNITKNIFHVFISVRSDERSMDRDMDRAQQIINAINNNGFMTKDKARSYWSIKHDGTSDGKKIRAHDIEFRHPSNAYNLVTNLEKECSKYKLSGHYCYKDCEKSLHRNVTVNIDNISYQILTFRRR